MRLGSHAVYRTQCGLIEEGNLPVVMRRHKPDSGHTFGTVKNNLNRKLQGQDTAARTESHQPGQRKRKLVRIVLAEDRLRTHVKHIGIVQIDKDTASIHILLDNGQDNTTASTVSITSLCILLQRLCGYVGRCALIFPPHGIRLLPFTVRTVTVGIPRAVIAGSHAEDYRRKELLRVNSTAARLAQGKLESLKRDGTELTAEVLIGSGEVVGQLCHQFCGRGHDKILHGAGE